MKHKRFIAGLCSLTLLVALTGCASQNTTDGSSQTAADYSSQTLIGKVTAWDGSTATLQLGSMPPAPAQDTTPPEKPAGDEQGNAAPPEQPADSADNKATAGEKSTTRPERKKMDDFAASDETATLDLSQADIQLEQGHTVSAASLEDIALDQILSVDINETNTVTAVTIKTMPDPAKSDNSDTES